MNYRYRYQCAVLLQELWSCVRVATPRYGASVWRARCPCHPETGLALTITDTARGDIASLYCEQGCSAEVIIFGAFASTSDRRRRRKPHA